ncbi:MAG: tetratricopeptide repeat protein [Algicola sp.]|nr:tetratricopeptide repeat protein [Algicola sp.]
MTQPSGEPSSTQIKHQLDTLLASQTFAKSERLSELLRFIVNTAADNRADELTPYHIGIKVYQRDATFNPHKDSIVRVNAKRLRSKLKAHYDSPAAQDATLQIHLPERTLIPVFVANGQTAADVVTQQPKPAKIISKSWLGIVAGFITLLIIFGYFNAGNFKLTSTEQSVQNLEIQLALKSQSLAAQSFATEDYKNALVNYRKSILYDDSNADHRRSLGQTELKLALYNKAEQTLLSALKQDQSSTTDSQHVTTDLSLLGELYKQTGQYDKALSFLSQALSSASSSENPLQGNDLAIHYARLALVQGLTGNFTAARQNNETALSLVDVQQTTHRAQLSEVLAINAELKYFQGHYLDATIAANEALAIALSHFGETHSVVAARQYRVGNLFLQASQPEQAQQYFDKSLQTYHRIFGEKHPTIARIINKTGEALFIKRQFSQAASHYQRALEIGAVFLPASRLDKAAVLHNIGILHLHQKQPAKAQDHFAQSLAIYQQISGLNHQAVATLWRALGDAHRDLDKPQIAENYYAKALPVYQRVYGPGHQQTVKLIQAIASNLKRSGQLDKTQIID